MPTLKKRRLKKNKFQNYVFPYVRFHEKSYPLIPVTLRHRQHNVNTFALLDSGASISVFRPEILKALHLPKKPREIFKLGTANGRVTIRVFGVEIQVEATHFMSKVGFSSQFAANFNILGREGFFNRFSVCFNEVAKNVIMVPINRLPR